MRRIAALALTTLVSLAALTALGSPLARASSASGSKACPSTKQSKSNSMSGMDMGHGHSSSKKKSSMSNCPTVAGAQEVAVTASAFSFSPSELTLTAGEPVTIKLTATDLEHDFTVQKYGHVVHAMPKKTAKGGLVIDKPGTYKFWCTVKGHKTSGMVGTITVLPPDSTTTTMP
jgi:heme/copper-type cytochrome/quinol oxidase subunit 2